MKCLSNFMFLIVACIFAHPTKAIKVTFGTSGGPIVPEAPRRSTKLIRTDIPLAPAPVSERTEDLPNPSTYRPLIPHQYRTKLYSYKPNPNLILGTPLDIRYTPSLQKFEIHQKSNEKARHLSYTGPHVFEIQEYEYLEPFRFSSTNLQQSVRYIKPEIYNNKNLNSKNVPEIGVVYSSGVRYYVPQNYNSRNADDTQQNENSQEENSVYDKNDNKYYYPEQ